MVVGRNLEGLEKKLFDLIVRRFLANFSEDAVFERVVAKIDVGKYEFRLSGRRTLRAGWMRYYKYAAVRDTPVPELDEGDLLKVGRALAAASAAFGGPLDRVEGHVTFARLLDG